jgi:hypothetical protein
VTAPVKPEITTRLQRALAAFQHAQVLLLDAYRHLKALPADEVEAFWRGPGGRIEQHLFAAATEVNAAYQAFAVAGQVASSSDRHLVTEARRLLATDR